MFKINYTEKMTKIVKNRHFMTSKWRHDVIFRKKCFFQNLYWKISSKIGWVNFFRRVIIWVKNGKNTFFGRFPNSVIQNPYQMAKFHKHRPLGRAPRPQCPISGILTLWTILHRFIIVKKPTPPPRFCWTLTSNKY